MIAALISLACIAASAVMVETVHAGRHNQVKAHLKSELEKAASARSKKQA